MLYSCADAAQKGIGWLRAGFDISYYSNSYPRNNSAGEGVNCYYTLSFTMEFHNPRDTYLIAYSYPYTLSDYRSHMLEIISKPGASDVIRCSQLCTTLGGQDCDLVEFIFTFFIHFYCISKTLIYIFLRWGRGYI